MPKRTDLTGLTFGRLTVLGYSHIDTRGYVCWNCSCECGNTVVVRGKHLTSGTTKSCGCLRSERIRASLQKHGLCDTRLHRIWRRMKERCFNPAHSSFHCYGGRGITVCEEWCRDFTTFYHWAMANGYRDDLTIDRIDVNGNYEPTNCRWATQREQSNNRRTNLFLTYNGKTQTLAEWCRETGLGRSTIYRRLYTLGWSIEKALTTPPRPIKKRG